MKKPRVLVNGAFGKMGQVAVVALKDCQEFELVASLGHQDDLAVTLAAMSVDIVVDLTRADSVFANSLAIIDAGCRPVIGTSGLTSQQVQQLQHQCAELSRGGLIVPNFSLAAVLMMQCAATISRYLPEVEIIEGHHPHKQDAPSATALKTAQEIAHARQVPLSQPHTKRPVARGEVHHGVPIHSLRLSGILAQQEVMFAERGETLSLVHRTLDRVSFMPGLLLACRRVMGLSSLYYGLEHVLD